MALWRENGFAENLWAQIEDDALLPNTGALIVSVDRCQRDREAMSQRVAPVGVEVAACKDALEHLADAVATTAGPL